MSKKTKHTHILQPCRDHSSRHIHGIQYLKSSRAVKMVINKLKTQKKQGKPSLKKKR